MNQNGRHAAEESTALALLQLKNGASWRQLAQALGYTNVNTAAAMLCNAAGRQPGGISEEAEADLRKRIGLRYFTIYKVKVASDQEATVIGYEGEGGVLHQMEFQGKVTITVKAKQGAPRKRKAYMTVRMPKEWQEFISPAEARELIGYAIAGRRVKIANMARKAERELEIERRKMEPESEMAESASCPI